MHLVVLGEGPFADHLTDRIDPSRVTQLGWVPHDEAARVVASFDALPLTYSPDRPCYFSPLKLMEAMACGVVPIVPRLGDLEHAVAHEERGLIYPAGDADALAQSIRRLVDDDHLRAQLASRARSFAEKNSWSSIAREVLDVVTPREFGAITADGVVEGARAIGGLASTETGDDAIRLWRCV